MTVFALRAGTQRRFGSRVFGVLWVGEDEQGRFARFGVGHPDEPFRETLHIGDECEVPDFGTVRLIDVALVDAVRRGAAFEVIETASGG